MQSLPTISNARLMFGLFDITTTRIVVVILLFINRKQCKWKTSLTVSRLLKLNQLKSKTRDCIHNGIQVDKGLEGYYSFVTSVLTCSITVQETQTFMSSNTFIHLKKVCRGMGVTSRRSSFNIRNFCECSKGWHHANKSLRTLSRQSYVIYISKSCLEDHAWGSFNVKPMTSKSRSSPPTFYQLFNKYFAGYVYKLWNVFFTCL